MKIQEKIEATQKQLQDVQTQAEQSNQVIQQEQNKIQQLQAQYNVLVGRLNTLQEIAQERQSVFFQEAPAEEAGESQPAEQQTEAAE